MKLVDLFKEEDCLAWKGKRKAKTDVINLWKSKFMKVLNCRKNSRELRAYHRLPEMKDKTATTIGSKSWETAFPPGREVEETSFNPGVGVGGFLLLAKTRHELEKTIELQMEPMLNDIKHELIQRKDTLSNPDQKGGGLVHAPFNSNGLEGTKDHHHGTSNCRPSTDLVDPPFCTEKHNQYPDSMSEQHSRHVGKDQIEAKLEAELEFMPLRLDALSSGQQSAERCSENVALPARSFAEHFRKDCVHRKACSKEKHEVCPNYLETRLHEVLQTRQKERIVELESELESTECSIRKKEKEIQWLRQCTDLFAGHTGGEKMFSR